MAQAVRRPAAAADPPRVADDALDDVELDLVGDHALVDGRAEDDVLDEAAVGRRRSHGLEERGEVAVGRA